MILIIVRYASIISGLIFLSACVSDPNSYTVYPDGLSGPVQLKVEAEPSKNNSSGECLADTLSFLIGQPETALAAMEYPVNTRVLTEGQDLSMADKDETRLNLVIGFDRRIVNVFCG